MQRHSISSLIREAFVNVNEERITAHSLRRKLQTDLEKAGINSNWIDQILGHQLINSRDAYSLPTDEELEEAYTKAYQFIKVYPESNVTQKKITRSEAKESLQIMMMPKSVENQQYSVKTATTLAQAIELISQGYQYVDTIEGTRIYKKQI